MKVSEGAQQTRVTKVASTAFGMLAALSIVAMVICFAAVTYFANFDREYISRADSVRVLSQAIAKNASEAANGNLDAFALLETALGEISVHLDILRNGNPETQLPPTEESSVEAGQALDRIFRPWGDMQENAKAVLERREMVVSVNAVAEGLRVESPRLQRLSDELARRLADIGAERGQIYVATRNVMHVERMRRHLGEMLQGGMGNVAAAQQLAASLEELGLGVEGLLQGSNELGVSRVVDTRSRQMLTELSALYERVAGQVAGVLEQSPDLFRLRDAAATTFRTSDQVLLMADYLITKYREMGEQRLVQDWMAFAFGALAVLLLIVRGVLARRVSLAEVQAKEAEKTRLDEQARRNQEAILNLLDEIEGLKEGDLTVQASVGEEITGAIGDAFNDAIDALRSLVTTINETSVQVSSAAQQTQATAMHLAEASDHQAHQITAVSAAVNEMAVSIDQVSKNAAESARVAQQSVDLSVKGAETVQRTIEGMDAIREQIQETSKRIKRLGESSQEIGNIVELINDIADQTNILALNASIQAAMAGESGRGFAVVADEVQRLAERSGNATKQIEALVKTIQTDTNEAVISMEQSTAGVVAGAKLAEDAGDALREIESVSKQLASLIQNISEASRQQANAAANISDTMNVIQEITSQTSAGTNETATSIGNLADLANELRNSVAGFKLPE